MAPENRINLNKVQYFPLKEYINRIKLHPNILEHLEETSEEFDKYMKKLTTLDEKKIFQFLLFAFNNELRDSNLIENHLIDPLEVTKKNIFFDSLNINHKRIKDLHKFVTNGEGEYEYRKVDAWIRKLSKEKETIFWYGADPKDIQKFIDDFIEIYKNKSLSIINNNAIIKSALMHLLFVRIHPFKDGNGRTARIIQDMKFTESINNAYNLNLKISPLHLSQSIYMNYQQYYNTIDSIYFDLNHDCNDEINKWFEFILNMYDEQIYYCSNNLKPKVTIALDEQTDFSHLISKQLKKARK